MYRYYLRLRPAMPGTIPTKNLDRIENFDYRIFDNEAGMKVWGYVEYTEPLTAQDIEEYELAEPILWHLTNTTDGSKIIGRIGLEASRKIEEILSSYERGKINLIVPRYEDGEPDFYGDFELDVRDSEYVEDGREIIVLRWYEDYGEDTERVIEAFKMEDNNADGN